MKSKVQLVLFSFLLLFLFSCSKDDSSGDTLDGDTNIALTAVDSTSSVYLYYGNENVSNSYIKVKSRNAGVVSYDAVFDISTLSDASKLKIIDYYAKAKSYYTIDPSMTITPDQKLKFNFKVKITSDGYLDYFTDGKPWVMVKYDDGVGTEYSVTNNKGEKLTRTITEKTGKDDWPFVFFKIKTTKVVQMAASDDPLLERIEYRVNHKFGLVHLEYFLKDGTNLKVNIVASFI